MSELEEAIGFGCTAKQTADIVRMLDDGTLNKRGAQMLAKILRKSNGTVVGALGQALEENPSCTEAELMKRVNEILEERKESCVQ